MHPKLVGGWRLVQSTAFVDGAPAGEQVGPDAGGQLVYAADGTMSAILHTASREVFGTPQFHQGSAARGTPPR